MFIDIDASFYAEAIRLSQDISALKSSVLVGDMVGIMKIADNAVESRRNAALKILSFFNIKTNDYENIWELVEDVRMQVYSDLYGLTGEEYRIDFDRHSGSVYLFYRHRRANLDSCRDCQFIIDNVYDNIPKGFAKNSTVHGIGLFAREDIAPGEVLSHLDGQIIEFEDYEELSRKLGAFLGRHTNFFLTEWNGMADGKVLARAIRTKYSLINHTFDESMVNVEVVPNDSADTLATLLLVSTKEIKKGEEILLDYRKEPIPRGYFLKSSSQYLDPVCFAQD